MNQRELNEAARKHRLWLDPNTRSPWDFAEFEEVKFDGLVFDSLNFDSARFGRCTFVKCTFKHCDFGSVDFSEADFTSAVIHNCSFRDSYCGKATFEGAKIDDTDFDRADLENAIFTRANLSLVSLKHAHARQAEFDNASLHGCGLQKTRLYRANFHGAQMREVNFFEADAERALFDFCYMQECDGHEADFRKASFIRANITKSTFKMGLFMEADFTSASIINTEFIDADMENANFNNTHFELVSWEGAELQGTILDAAASAITSKKALGKVGRAVRRASAQQLPMQAAAFKKLFPEHYQLITDELKGRPITAPLLAEIVAKHALAWDVSESKYVAKVQRLSPKPNEVLQLNVNMKELAGGDANALANLRAVREVSVRSGHPVLKAGDYFTVGWVRYAKLDPEKVLLIEEVQSDVPTVRFGLKDPAVLSGLRERGLSAKDVEAALALLEPFAARFYQDAIGLAFEVAAELGFVVEMLSYRQKASFGSPKSVYEELPKSMGMRKVDKSSTEFIEGNVWRIVPNPRKS